MRTRLMLLIPVTGILLASCSHSGRAPIALSTTSTSQTSPATSATGPPAPSTTTTSPSPSTTTTKIPGGPTMCTAGQLTVTIMGVDGGVGHSGFALRFENTAKACIVHGYPGLDASDATGKVVESAQRTPYGYLGGLKVGATAPNVELQTGQTASALYEGSTGPIPGRPCPTYTTLVVTAPNETHPVTIASPYNICYLEIHPVVPGTTGTAI